ncbi:ceramide-1-phosphate transfer protein [Conger conger]|uniref:ceramide-1-phosphate transfer protein n=1 Tax=Conger conger TaxID=82655 RepID=UPI002A5A4824|nr:ceramide-1-phosphate transfer protein [Conger conger]
MLMKGNVPLGARFLYRFLLPVAIFSFLLFLGSVRLPDGTVQQCEASWLPCLGLYAPEFKPVPSTLPSDTDGNHGDGLLLSECPGQNFQVSRLLSDLHSALGPGSEVLLQPYLSSWDELIKFMESLGAVVEFFSQKVRDKVSVIRRLAQEELERQEEGPQRMGTGRNKHKDPGSLGNTGPEAENQLQHLGADGENERGSYKSVRSMIRTELSRGMVDFERETASGCRNLLRLNRSLLWLQLFLKNMADGPDADGRLRSPGELCREAYQQALAPYHPWLIRRAAEIVILAMPEWDTFFRLVCVHSQAEAAPVLDRVVRAIEEVYSRTQGALQEHGMLELP